MRNFNVIAKGEYPYKQTNEFLRVGRFLIVRKKSRRFLLLDLENRRDETLTALSLQIDQFDVRGNFLGSVRKDFKNLSFKKSKFILKKNIELHRACIDCQVKIACAEYGNYAYHLGENDVFVTYEKKKKKPVVNAEEVKRELGEEGFSAKIRRHKIPVFLSVFAGVILIAATALSYMQLDRFKKEEDEFFLANLRYEFVDSEDKENSAVNIVGYVGLGGDDIVIPASVDGHTVQRVNDGAFEGNTNIEKLTVQGGVEIGANAFRNCDNLQTLVIEDEILIGDNAFYSCDRLQSVRATNLTTIGMQAFYGCSALESLLLTATEDDKVLEMGGQAFGGGSTYTDITIDQYVRYGDACDYFSGVSSVDSLQLRNYNLLEYESVGNISKPIAALFGEGTKTVKNVRIEETDSIPADFTINCNGALESVTIDVYNGSSIGNNAFKDCGNLKNLSLPAPVATVGEYAFAGSGITSFNGKALTEMGKGAFQGCASLTQIQWDSARLKTIPDLAFAICTSLVKLVIPEKVTMIGAEAFKDCTALHALTFDAESELEDISATAFWGCEALRNVVLPSKLERIGANAFLGCSQLRYVSIPASVSTIANDAFDQCYRLHEIENLSPITIVEGAIGTPGEYALRVYTSAEEERMPKQTVGEYVLGKPYDKWYLLEYTGKGGDITLPTGVTETTGEGENAVVETKPYTIVSYFFIGDQTVTGVKIPATADTLGRGVFTDSGVKNIAFINDGSEACKNEFWFTEALSGNTTLESVDFGARVIRTPSTEAGVLPTEFLKECGALKTVVLPVALRAIGASAFANCVSLENVTMPATLERIENNAFADCTQLKTVQLPDSVTTIGDYAFYACESLESVTMPSSLTMVGMNAFENCTSLSSLSFSNEAETTIGNAAFNGCTALASVSFGGVKTINQRAFNGCTKLNSISWGDVQGIGREAFCGCTALKTLSLGANVQIVSVNAFLDCTALTSVSFGGTRTIDEGAFKNCTALNTINFTNSVTAIGRGAFSGCTALTSVVLPNNLASVSYGVFYDCTALEKVTVPASVTAIDTAAFQGCKNLHEVYNYSSLTIQPNTTDHGSIAYNAVVVHTNVNDPLHTYTSNGFVFKANGTVTALVDYTGSDTEVILNTKYASGRTMRDYIVARYAFEDCDTITKLTIGNGVDDIRSEAFLNMDKLQEVRFDSAQSDLTVVANSFSGCAAVQSIVIPDAMGASISSGAFSSGSYSVYYRGDSSSWSQNSYKYSVTQQTVYYYYTQCSRIHEWGSYWNEVDGKINTTYIGYGYNEVEATCTASGYYTYTCDDCNYYERHTLSALGHSYDNGKCKRCDHVSNLIVTRSSQDYWNPWLTITGEADIFNKSYSAVYTTNAEKDSIQTVTFKAKRAISLSFYCSTWNTESGSSLVVDKNDTQLGATLNGRDSDSFTATLAANDTVTITFTNLMGDEDGTLDIYARIYNIRITATD